MGKQIGFIAQEVASVTPELVSNSGDGYLGVNYAGFTPYLVNAIKQLNAKIFGGSATSSTTTAPTLTELAASTTLPMNVKMMAVATNTEMLATKLFGTTTNNIGLFSDASSSLESFSGSFLADILRQFLAWAGNGIQAVYANVFHADKVQTKELCVDDVCVTKDKFLQMVNGPVSAAATGASAPAAAVSTAPVISINGANPATVTMGTSYSDLGATIASPESAKNLGIVTLLDGATTTSVSLDTSAAGTHTVTYLVTTPEGVTGSATRTIKVTAGEASPATPVAAPMPEPQVVAPTPAPTATASSTN